MRALLAITAAALLLPAAAAAHVGKAPPVASDFVAHVERVPDGVEAQVIEADQGLWLRLGSARTVIVHGFQGEPYLRLSAAGVEENASSPTAAVARGRTDLPAAGAAPRWTRVADGRSFAWTEPRLHGPGGHWSVPLSVDGRAARVAGTNQAVDPPSRAWFTPIVVAVLAAIVLLRLRRPRLDAAVALGGSAVALAAIVLARAGRAFYGHPEVPTGQLVGFAVTVALAAAAAVLLASRTWRTLAALLIAGAGVYVGLTLVKTLTLGHVLAALPGWLERGAAVTALAAGLAVGIVVAAGEASELWSAARD